MDALMAVLSRQVASQQALRFKITELPEDEVYKMLWQCYRAEVAKRNMKFVDDQATRDRVRKAASWLCGDHKPGLLLYGRVGSGKSTLGRAIVRLINFLYDRYELGSDKRCSVTVCSALDMSRLASDDISRIGQFKTNRMLFLDDMGMEPPVVKNWGNEYTPVVEILYARYDRQLFTLVTSNLRGDDFRQRYGDRIGDRMLEMFDTIEFNQTMSYRK